MDFDVHISRGDKYFVGWEAHDVFEAVHYTVSLEVVFAAALERILSAAVPDAEPDAQAVSRAAQRAAALTKTITRELIQEWVHGRPLASGTAREFDDNPAALLMKPSTA